MFGVNCYQEVHLEPDVNNQEGVLCGMFNKYCSKPLKVDSAVCNVRHCMDEYYYEILFSSNFGRTLYFLRIF